MIIIDKRLYLIILAAVAAIGGWAADQQLDSLLHALDHALEMRPKYEADKEERIAKMRFESQWVADGPQRFEVLGRLLDEFNYYNCDSALAVCAQRDVIAKKMGSKEMKLQNDLSTAYALMVSGMYKEALDLLEPINEKALGVDERNPYYHVVRSVYGLMADYAVRREEKERYTALTQVARDSLLQTFPQESIYRALVLADKYNASGEPEKAAKLVLETLSRAADNQHALAVSAYTLSESYRLMGNEDEQRRYLMISAIADMESGTREYVSLRKLALLLYQDGDVDRASRYLRQCMYDAQRCNARFRMIETDDVYNAVNEVYLAQIAKQKGNLRWALVGVGVLALLLLWAVLLVAREMKKVEAVNQQLTQANRAIAETSTLKEEYIAQYMDQCSSYIDKLDQQRRALAKIAKTGTIDDLKRYAREQGKADKEINDFYQGFDEAFLKIFPTFVEDFNLLLLPEERIEPKAKGKLNAELRIYALIRLGITDSAKIARFLRYSLNTIYSYRTRMRNKAMGDRNQFEAEVMRIGELR